MTRRRREVVRAQHRGEALGELRVVEQPVRDVDGDAELVPRVRPLLRGAECVGDDEEGQLANERRPLDVRDELGRRHEPPVREDATDQRLG